MLEFQVIHQKIIRTDNFFVVADSKNYLKASFSFTSEWTGSITAVFQLKGRQEGYYQVLDENNTCFVPCEVLSEACGFYASVFCGDLITANKVFIPVNASGMINGTTPAEPTPDVYTQILGIAEEAENIAQSVRRDADEGLFDGKQGEPGTTDYNELENKPDLSVYATTEEVDEKIANIPGVTNVYSKEETDNAIKNAVDNLAEGQVATNTANIGTLQTTVGGKADKDSVYTKSETEEKISDYALSVDTKYGASLSLTVNTSTYVLTAQLKDQNGNNLGSAQTVDLPLESVVVGGSYDDTTKKVKLTLQNGSTVEFSVADLIAGLQTEITESNKLNADLVDDSTTVNKFVTSSEKTTWNNKQSAISDLANIRSGASLGSTAVQPNQLSTVATSGSYNDLSNKPTIPATTSQLTNDSGFLQNIATGLNSLSVSGVISGAETATNIGFGSRASGNYSIAVGNAQATSQFTVAIGSAVSGSETTASGESSVAIGAGAKAISGSTVSIGFLSEATNGMCVGTRSKSTSAFGLAVGTFSQSNNEHAIQFGCGTNNEAHSCYIATSQDNNWKVLGGNGKIPNERINIDTTATSGSTNAISSGAVFSLVGNLETALNTINSGV